VRGIESSYVAARAREQALEAEAKRQEQKALELKHIGVQYAVLQEDVNINRTLYESVLKRLSETNVSNDLAISNIQIMQRADLPIITSSPQTARNLLLGAILGLLFGVGMAFLLDYLDTAMSTPEHVERAVSLNTLGVVPDLNGVNRLQLEWKQSDRSMLARLKNMNPFHPSPRAARPIEMLLTQHHPQSIFPESYRSIRTSLLFSRPDQPPQIIILTSASPGEGKTGTSLNLSIALAQDGRRVLLIDADLRKGCCHDRLGMTNHKGLSNILTGNLALEEGIQATPISGLSLLSCGVCPPSPADLLGSKKMKDVLTRLREIFEFIIIDTPPAVALADASVLSVMSDGVVLVFHGKKTTPASARQLIARLDGVRAPVLGVILNGVDMQNPEFAYYGHYRSYYPENEQSPVENKNGNSPTQTIQKPHSNGTSTQLLTKTEQQPQAAKPTASPSGRENGGDRINVKSNGDERSKSQDEVRPAAEIVPQESLNQLIVSLGKSLGPATSSLVVREEIANLGESFFAFPKRRMGELLKLIQRKITQRSVTFL
jgi:polysaccharide biosynthesis transport protein